MSYRLLKTKRTKKKRPRPVPTPTCRGSQIRSAATFPAFAHRRGGGSWSPLDGNSWPLDRVLSVAARVPKSKGGQDPAHLSVPVARVAGEPLVRSPGPLASRGCSKNRQHPWTKNAVENSGARKQADAAPERPEAPSWLEILFVDVTVESYCGRMTSRSHRL